jgi:hypothetical protein
MTIELTEHERELLAELLSAGIKVMLVEIRHTRSREYREGLKARESALESLLARLNPAATP